VAKAPTILAPKKTGKTLKGMFLRYQREWINDNAPLKLMDKSRRTGITFGEAYDAVSRRYRKTQPRDADYWMSSADESAAFEFIDYCRFFAKELFSAVADYYTDAIEDEQTKRLATAHCIRCPNGKRIVGLTSNPRRFRSKGGDVCLDEYAFHDEPQAMLKAASPVTTWGGSLRIISTHNGESSDYNQAVQRCRRVLQALGQDPDSPPRGIDWKVLVAKALELRLTPVYSYHRVTIVDAIAQGIVEKINVKRTAMGMESVSDEDFLTECRIKSPGEEAFLEEYMCQPGTDKGAWLTYQLIESCEHEDCPQPGDGLVGWTGNPLDIGVDVGRVHDKTVIWAVEPVGDVKWTRHVEIIDNLPLPEQQQRLHAFLDSVKWRRCCIDNGSFGAAMVDYAQSRYGEHRVEGVNFTAAVKLDLAVRLKSTMQDRGMRMPHNNRRIRDGLHKVRKEVTPAGNERFVADRDDEGHADEFWAMALALHAGQQAVAPFEWTPGETRTGAKKGGLW